MWVGAVKRLRNGNGVVANRDDEAESELTGVGDGGLAGRGRTILDHVCWIFSVEENVLNL
jgi:hypothetical protein